MPYPAEAAARGRQTFAERLQAEGSTSEYYRNLSARGVATRKARREQREQEQQQRNQAVADLVAALEALTGLKVRVSGR